MHTLGICTYDNRNSIHHWYFAGHCFWCLCYVDMEGIMTKAEDKLLASKKDLTHLFELQRNTKFMLDGEKYTLERIDGMYSRCFDSNGNLLHIAAFTDVEPC